MGEGRELVEIPVHLQPGVEKEMPVKAEMEALER